MPAVTHSYIIILLSESGVNRQNDGFMFGRSGGELLADVLVSLNHLHGVLEQRSDRGLNKEQLREERKGEIVKMAGL